ncbi:hypothetical protein Bca4012_047531 [Brassica carinata]
MSPVTHEQASPLKEQKPNSMSFNPGDFLAVSNCAGSSSSSKPRWRQQWSFNRRRRKDEPSSQLPPSPSLFSSAYPHRPSEILRLPRSPQLSLPLRSQRRNPYAAPELEPSLDPSGVGRTSFLLGQVV